MEENTSTTPSTPANSNNNMKIILAVVVLIVIAGGIYFFTNRHQFFSNQQTSPMNNSTQTTNPTSAAQSTGVSPSSAMEQNVKEFTVTGSNFKFDPSVITVKKGDTVKITFKNADGFHDWNLDEFNAHTKKIPSDQEDSVQFVADKTGSFEYYCSVGNHRAMGMKGTLTVE